MSEMHSEDKPMTATEALNGQERLREMALQLFRSFHELQEETLRIVVERIEAIRSRG